MKKSTLLVAALLVALGGTVHAQSAAATDPVVQLHAEEKAANKTYADKKKAVDGPYKAKIKAAGDKAAADATAKGQDPAVARRDAEAKVKAADKPEHDAKMKELKKEHDAALAEIRKKYPAPSTKPGTAGTPK
jgi:hypothetical protein